MTLDDFLATCEGVRPAGHGYACLCPAHSDVEASLGVSEGDDGRILVQCYAGCETAAVLAAKGMSWGALFPTRDPLAQTPERIYTYTDEAGNTLFEVVRFPSKRFFQRHWDPASPDAKPDGWVWGMEGVRRVLYRLPEVLAAVAAGRRVYITAGEKDADRVTAETGETATCNPMGEGKGKWKDDFNPVFTGAYVTIIQDRDEAGRRHAAHVKESLLPYAAQVLVLQAKRGKDFSDHADAGCTIEQLVIPRALPARGIVNGAAMAEAGLEYLAYRPTDIPGWHLIPGIEGTVVKQGRIYAGGGYTGDGKTALALQGTRQLASQGVRCGYFSMEMSDTDLRNRFAAHRGIPLALLEKPWELRGNPEMLALYRAAMEEIKGWSIDIIYDTTLKPERVIEETFNREYEFVVIDHIHRFGWGDRRVLETNIQQLTNLSLDANIPILVLCQLRRYQRGKDMVAYPPPVLQDFRETEMLGNEASLAFAVWRQRDDAGLRYLGDTSRFTVLKNRHTTSEKDEAGHIDTIDFNRTTQLFTPGGLSAQPTQPRSADPAWED